ncbi:MAG: hypothetical protein VB064_05315 [Oscillospiraceae bacterium]|nr:hypothetical protein [Oscillospiraceae bacterium]
MANLEQIVNQKTQSDTQWKLERQAERENASAMQDSGITEITSNPEAYARYLDMQGDNPTYSAGNIALVMLQDPEATQFGTSERWKTLGRSVLDAEAEKGVKIFARTAFSKGTILTDAYDIRQTQGHGVKENRLQKDSREMEDSLTTLLNYSVVPVTIDKELDGPALYDEAQMELVINPNYDDNISFAHIAAEVAHSRFHAKGTNRNYDRAECELDAQSVSYILCRRFGINRELPDVSGVATLYEGWEPQERRQALDCVQDMSKQIGGSIERAITTQQRSAAPIRRATR